MIEVQTHNTDLKRRLREFTKMPSYCNYVCFTGRCTLL